MTISRRSLLKGAGLTGGASLLLGPSRVASAFTAPAAPDAYGVLVDLSVCEGCHACEEACNEQNGLPKPEAPFDAEAPLGVKRRPGGSTFTVVSTYPDPAHRGEVVNVKTQCMHCLEPTCASACPVGAFTRTPEGAVVYDETICMGCRYCVAACPFGVPHYEFESAFSPRVQKCVLCLSRIREDGLVPACVDACPAEATTFGKRADLIKLARRKLLDPDEGYVDHIYGEREAGGTSWLYISKVPFEALGFPMNLEMQPYINLTKGAVKAVPLVLVLGPAFLMGMNALAKRIEEGEPAPVPVAAHHDAKNGGSGHGR
ncbi:MAG: 4Fe-4S dicluster domain-containing protein [Deltaproteobacteria bacterium]|nr:MAG: 4Fe-4S dicluster domain-containing protein [Deltaproteobacteria bacterium]